MMGRTSSAIVESSRPNAVTTTGDSRASTLPLFRASTFRLLAFDERLTERCESGRFGRSRKPLSRKGPWVRIPPSPPHTALQYDQIWSGKTSDAAAPRGWDSNGGCEGTERVLSPNSPAVLKTRPPHPLGGAHRRGALYSSRRAPPPGVGTPLRAPGRPFGTARSKQ